MINKKIVLSVIFCLLVAVLSFWGGEKYGQSNNLPINNSQTSFGQNQNGQRMGFRGGSTNGNEFISGNVLSKDSKNLTVELRGGPSMGNKGGNNTPTQSGGSKIILFSPSTSIEKTISGSTNDIVVGSQITINGSSNPDGSINATSIQIKPTLIQNKTN